MGKDTRNHPVTISEPDKNEGGTKKAKKAQQTQQSMYEIEYVGNASSYS